MPKLDEELEVDSEEESDEVPYEDEEEDELEDEGEEPVVAQQRPSNLVANLRSQLAQKDAEIASLSKRLGDAVRTGGERLKAKDEEIQTWLENVQVWAEGEIAAAKEEGFQEGVASVEARTLKLLPVEERAAYYEATRSEKRQVSPRKTEPLNIQRSKASEAPAEGDLNELVDQFVEQGVPLDQLEQTSAKAVVASGTRYLKKVAAEAEAEKRDIESKLEVRDRENSGAARVSSGGTGGTTVNPKRSTDLRRVEEINAELRQLRGRNMDRATKLLNERKVIEARLRRKRPI